VALLAWTCGCSRDGFDVSAVLGLRAPAVIAAGYCSPVDIADESSVSGAVLELTVDDGGAPGELFGDRDCTVPLGATSAGPAGVRVFYRGALGPGELSARVVLTATAHGSASHVAVEVRLPATGVALGTNHSCFIIDGSSLACAGADTRGQMGLVTGLYSTIIPTPRLVSAFAGGMVVSALATGIETSFVIADTLLWAFGDDTEGELGVGSPSGTSGTATPQHPVGLANGVTSVSAGFDFACAVKDGGAWCWGDNSAGQLGTNVGPNSRVPVPVDGLGSGVVLVAAGVEHACAILAGGELWCWGDDTLGALGDGPVDSTGFSPVLAIASGVTAATAGRHTCAIVGGGVRCWGQNYDGELGIGSFAIETAPQPVPGLESGVTLLVASYYQTCAVQDGDLLCWGNNRSGVFLDGTRESSSEPIRVPLPPGRIEYVASGGSSRLADEQAMCVVIDGVARCWGATNLVPDGIAKSSAMPARARLVRAGVTSMDLGSAGTAHGCVVEGGAVRCWGRGGNGQLGDGQLLDSTAPVTVSGLPSTVIDAIAVGVTTSAAIAGGAAYRWGGGLSVATPVPLLSSGVTRLSAGEGACAVQNGGLWCWGSDLHGQLGDGLPHDGSGSDTPVQVAGMDPASGVTDVSCSFDHACAMQSGAVWCWGNNFEGQLGGGTTGGNSNVPVPVTGLPSSVTAVQVGISESCALAGDAVYCWGRIDDSSAVNTAVLVAGLASGVTQLAVGAHAVCAVRAGALECKGGNRKGQLGNGTYVGAVTPAPVIGLPPGGVIQRVALGGFYFVGHACAVVDGELYCWGDNSDRQLATGLPYSIQEPRPIAPWDSGP
jgi:alpha-tubulin suppressor-like RCC1 family protein